MNKSEGYMSITGHLHELRSRVVKILVFFVFAFIVCYWFSQEIYDFLLLPLKDIIQDFDKLNNTDFTLIYTDITEVFFVYLRVSLLFAFLVTAPFMIWQCYLFIAPALYTQERKILIPYLFSSPFLFAFGVFVVYYFIFPVAWKFFISIGCESGDNSSVPIEFMPSVSEYLDIVVQLMFAFGCAFQLPVLLAILVQFGIISYDTLVSKRRIAIVMIFIIAAILTPPDVLSQIGLAFPMIVLYEITIIAARYINKSKKDNVNENI
ncbi:twin-arginine translocase subunit TatC [Anaplasmataceae bacterium AB001_6]|nr:twin-arginine translocase subunit TatC [Anaplasmataceae bacterium AB001_6]